MKLVKWNSLLKMTLTLSLILGLGLMAGCGDDDDPTDPGGGGTLPDGTITFTFDGTALDYGHSVSATNLGDVDERIIGGTGPDGNQVIMITVPIYVPLVNLLGFDPLWFGILFIVNMQMAYLTPPFGFVLFYMKGVVPPSITMGDIYRSVWPFIGLQALCLLIIMFFPQVVLWLPSVVGM